MNILDDRLIFFILAIFFTFAFMRFFLCRTWVMIFFFLQIPSWKDKTVE